MGNVTGNAAGNLVGNLAGNGLGNDAVFFTIHMVKDDILFTNHARANMCNSYTFSIFFIYVLRSLFWWY